jgi:hypothetical protein
MHALFLQEEDLYQMYHFGNIVGLWQAIIERIITF